MKYWPTLVTLFLLLATGSCKQGKEDAGSPVPAAQGDLGDWAEKFSATADQVARTVKRIEAAQEMLKHKAPTAQPQQFKSSSPATVLAAAIQDLERAKFLLEEREAEVRDKLTADHDLLIKEDNQRD